MIESIVAYLQSLPPEGILLFACLITFVENIFPPSPSDILLVFCGTLIGLGSIGFLPLALSATIGSVLGFAIMFFLGKKAGTGVSKLQKLSFIPVSAIQKAENWFRQYGYWLIIANRFLSGTRAVIAFVAGASSMNFSISLLLSGISALLWNAILLWAGMELGGNWRIVTVYLERYSSAISPVILIIILFFVGRWLYRKKQKSDAVS
jgi:membrane protein DedA with SNARE-associated domain